MTIKQSKALDYLKEQTAIPVTMYGKSRVRRSSKSSTGSGFVPCVGKPRDSQRSRRRRTRHGDPAPGRCLRLHRAKAISHEYDSLICDEGLHSLVAVPVIVSRSLKGRSLRRHPLPGSPGDKVLEEVTMTARCLEQELAINEAMRERASGAPTQSATEGKAADDRSLRFVEQRRMEQVRATHSKLRMLTSRVEDETLRRDLEALCTQMVSRSASSRP